MATGSTARSRPASTHNSNSKPSFSNASGRTSNHSASNTHDSKTSQSALTSSSNNPPASSKGKQSNDRSDTNQSAGNASGTAPVKRGRPRGRPLGSTTKNKKKKPSQMLMDNERKKKRRMVTIGPSSSLLTMYEALTTVLLNSLGNKESTMADLKVVAQHTCKGWSVPPAELATDLQIVLSVFKVIGLIDYKMQDPGVKKVDKVVELATRGDFHTTLASFGTTGLEVAIQYLLSGIKPKVPKAFQSNPDNNKKLSNGESDQTGSSNNNSTKAIMKKDNLVPSGTSTQQQQLKGSGHTMSMTQKSFTSTVKPVQQSSMSIRSAVPKNNTTPATTSNPKGSVAISKTVAGDRGIVSHVVASKPDDKSMFTKNGQSTSLGSTPRSLGSQPQSMSTGNFAGNRRITSAVSSVAPAAMTMTVSAVTTKVPNEHQESTHNQSSGMNRNANSMDNKLTMDPKARGTTAQQTQRVSIVGMNSTNRNPGLPNSSSNSTVVNHKNISRTNVVNRTNFPTKPDHHSSLVGRSNTSMIAMQTARQQENPNQKSKFEYPKMVTKAPILCANWHHLARAGNWEKLYEDSGGSSTNHGAVLGVMCRLIAKERRPEWALYPQIMSALGSVAPVLEAKYGPNPNPNGNSGSNNLCDRTGSHSGARSRPSGSKSRAAAAAALLRYPSPETPSTIVSVHKNQDRVLASVDHYVARSIDLKVRKSLLMFKEEMLLSEICDLCNFQLPETKSIRPIPVDMPTFVKSQRHFLPGSPRLLPPEVEYRLSTAPSSQGRNRNSADKSVFSQERTFNAEDETRARLARRRVREVQRQLIKKKKHPAYIALATQTEESTENNSNAEHTQQSEESQNASETGEPNHATVSAGHHVPGSGASVTSAAGGAGNDEEGSKKARSKRKLQQSSSTSRSVSSTPREGSVKVKLSNNVEINSSCVPLAPEVASTQFEVCTLPISFANICEELFRNSSTPAGKVTSAPETLTSSKQASSISNTSMQQPGKLSVTTSDLKNNGMKSMDSINTKASMNGGDHSLPTSSKLLSEQVAATSAAARIIAASRQDPVAIPRWRIVPLVLPRKTGKPIDTTSVSMASGAITSKTICDPEEFVDAVVLKRHDEALERAKTQWEEEAEEKKKLDQHKKALRREASKQDIRGARSPRPGVRNDGLKVKVPSAGVSSKGSESGKKNSKTEQTSGVVRSPRNGNNTRTSNTFTTSVVNSNMITGQTSPSATSPKSSPTEVALKSAQRLGSNVALTAPKIPVVDTANILPTRKADGQSVPIRDGRRVVDDSRSTVALKDTVNAPSHGTKQSESQHNPNVASSKNNSLTSTQLVNRDKNAASTTSNSIALPKVVQSSNEAGATLTSQSSNVVVSSSSSNRTATLPTQSSTVKQSSSEKSPSNREGKEAAQVESTNNVDDNASKDSKEDEVNSEDESSASEDVVDESPRPRKKLRSPNGAIGSVRSSKSSVMMTPFNGDAPRKSGRVRTARKLYDAE